MDTARSSAPSPSPRPRVLALLLVSLGAGLFPEAAAAQAPNAGAPTAVADTTQPQATRPAPAARASSIPAPPDELGRKVHDQAIAARGLRIAVSGEARQLWLLDGDSVRLTAYVAVGSGKDFSFDGHEFHFATPRGVRRVLEKRVDPIWTVPDWHYYERATNEGLELVRLRSGRRYDLSDGSYLEVRGRQVGRVGADGRFWAVEPGLEIVIDGKLYMPPHGSAQRRVPGALGPFGLVMGDGYLIHGVHAFDAHSIGQAVSHGCVRMANDDLERLFSLVPVGTKIYLF